MQWIYPFPHNKTLPLVYRYSPNCQNQENFYNLMLGYPKCPIIGRYNKGQYKLSQIVSHLTFLCQIGEKEMKCGNRTLNFPKQIQYALVNIPELIPNNKEFAPKDIKTFDYHPISFVKQKYIKFTWIISYGQIGKDFFNYLNHTHIFGQEIFVNQKLQRNVHLLPIMVHFPKQSGLYEGQVERGLSVDIFRSQYMSIHLKMGAPAFSPNNMRLGIVKPIKKQLPQKHNENKKKKYKLKEPTNDKMQSKQVKLQQISKVQQPLFFDEEALKSESIHPVQFSCQEKSKQQQQLYEIKKSNKSQLNQVSKNKGFIHFYTSMLLQNDYRIYYHWHVEDEIRQNTINSLLKKSLSLQEFVNLYQDIYQQDSCIKEISHILNIK